MCLYRTLPRFARIAVHFILPRQLLAFFVLVHATTRKDSVMTSRFPTPQELASFPEPNYVDPVTRQPLVVGITTTMSALVIMLLFCRFYSRTVLVFALGWDDFIMLFAGVRLLLLRYSILREAELLT